MGRIPDAREAADDVGSLRPRVMRAGTADALTQAVASLGARGKMEKGDVVATVQAVLASFVRASRLECFAARRHQGKDALASDLGHSRPAWSLAHTASELCSSPPR